MSSRQAVHSNASRRVKSSTSASAHSREWDRRWGESVQYGEEDSSIENVNPARRILNKIPLKPPTSSGRSPDEKAVRRAMTSTTEEDDDTLGSTYSTDYINAWADVRSRMAVTTEKQTPKPNSANRNRPLYGRDSPVMATLLPAHGSSPSPSQQTANRRTAVPVGRQMYPPKQRSPTCTSPVKDDEFLSERQTMSFNSSFVEDTKGIMQSNLDVSGISLDESSSHNITFPAPQKQQQQQQQRRHFLDDSIDVGNDNDKDKYAFNVNEPAVDTTLIMSNRSLQKTRTNVSSPQSHDHHHDDWTACSESSKDTDLSEETSLQIAQCVADVGTDEPILHDSNKMPISPTLPQQQQQHVHHRTVSPPLLQQDTIEDKFLYHSDSPQTDTDTTHQPVSVIPYLNATASNYLTQGDYANAISCFERVLRVQQTVYGKKHHLVAATYHNIGIVYLKQLNYLSSNMNKASKEKINTISTEITQSRILAISAFRDAVLIAREALGEDHPNVATSLVRIAYLLLDVGQHSNALATFLEALRIRKNTLGEKHVLVAKLYNDIGMAHLKMNQYQAGYESFLCALEAQRSNPIHPHQKQSDSHHSTSTPGELDIADTLFNIATLCLEWTKSDHYDAEEIFSRKDLVDMALSHIDQAVKIRRRNLGEMHILSLQAQILLKRAKVESKNIQDDQDCSLNESDASEHKSDTGSSPTLKIKHGISPQAKSETQMDHTSTRSNSTVSSVDLNSLPGLPRQVKGQRRSRRTTALDKYVTSVRSTAVPLYHSNSVRSWGFAESSSSFSHHSQSTGRESDSCSAEEEEESCMISVNEKSNRIDNDGNISAISPTDAARRITVFRPHSGGDGTTQSKGYKPPNHLQSQNVSKLMKAPTIGTNRSISNTRSLDDLIDPEILLQNPIKYTVEVHNCAVQYLKHGDIPRSLRFFQTLLEAQRCHFGEVHQNVGLTLHNIGIVYLKAERYDEALDAFEKAVRVRKGSTGKENEHVAESLVKVGIVLLLMKRFDDALYSFREALSIRRHALGHLHPSTARIYNNIGCVHVEFNELREARRAFEYALDIQRSALCYEPDNSNLLFGAATTLCNLGYLYSVRGMHQRASVVLLEALSLQSAVLGENDPTVIATLDNLADSLGKSGEVGQALRCYKDLITRLGLDTDSKGLKVQSVKDRKTLALILFKMSGLHRKQNDYEAAITKLLEASAYESSIASPKFSASVKSQFEALKNSLGKQEFDWI